MFEGNPKPKAAAVYLCEVIIGGRLPRIIPSCLIERSICFFQPLLVLQREPKIVFRTPVAEYRMISFPLLLSKQTETLALAGNARTYGLPGIRLQISSETVCPPAVTSSFAASRGSVTQMPAVNVPSVCSTFIAANRLAFFAGPICCIGYQN